MPSPNGAVLIPGVRNRAAPLGLDAGVLPIPRAAPWADLELALWADRNYLGLVYKRRTKTSVCHPIRVASKNEWPCGDEAAAWNVFGLLVQ